MTDWRKNYQIPSTTPLQLNRPYFDGPIPEAERVFLTPPESFHPLLKKIRTDFGISDSIPLMLTILTHEGSINVPSTTRGTSLRILIHSGTISLYRGLLNEDKDLDQLRFTLNDTQGVILTTQQCQKLRLSVRSKIEDPRQLWIIDVGYYQPVSKIMEGNKNPSE